MYKRILISKTIDRHHTENMATNCIAELTPKHMTAQPVWARTLAASLGLTELQIGEIFGRIVGLVKSMKFGRQLNKVLEKIKIYLAIETFQIHSLSGVPACLPAIFIPMHIGPVFSSLASRCSDIFQVRWEIWTPYTNIPNLLMFIQNFVLKIKLVSITRALVRMYQCFKD